MKNTQIAKEIKDSIIALNSALLKAKNANITVDVKVSQNNKRVNNFTNKHVLLVTKIEALKDLL